MLWQGQQVWCIDEVVLRIGGVVYYHVAVMLSYSMYGKGEALSCELMQWRGDV